MTVSPRSPEAVARGQRRRTAVGSRCALGVFAVATLLAPLLSTNVRAQQPAAAGAGDVELPAFTSIDLGFSRRFKVSHWCRAAFTILGGPEPVTASLTVTLADGDGYPSMYTAPQPVLLLPGRESRVSLTIKPGRADVNLTAALIDIESGRVIARHRFETRLPPDAMHPDWGLDASAPLYVTLGDGIGVDSALRMQEQLESGGSANLQSQVVLLADASELPTDWLTYDGVTAVVLSTSAAEIYRGLEAQGAQIEALDRWVRMGGTLVLCVGSQAAEILAPGAPLARFAPGAFVEVAPLAQFSALEDYAEDKSTQITGRRIEVPRLADVEGFVEAEAAADLPLVVRRPYGFGEIVFAAVDLDRAPLTRWPAREKFVSRLLGFPTRPQATDAESQTSYAYYGGPGDVTGVLRTKLDEFVGVRIAPFWFVAMLVLGYIALIGPIDYFFVRRVLKRMEFTWITFPAIVVVISVSAYFLAHWMKGDDLLVNQVDLVDVDTKSGLVRGTSWWNIFSPTSSSYGVSIVPRLPGGQEAAGADVNVAWLGPAESTMGMHSPASDPPLWARPYLFAPALDAMLGVPIQVWSTKSFTSQWGARSEEAATAIEATLRHKPGSTLAGQIRNRLDFPLADCFVVHGDLVYPLGTLAADEENRPSPAVELDGLARGATSLAPWIAARSTWGDDGQPTSNEPYQMYETYSLSVPAIMLRLMFFDAAGGKKSLYMTDGNRPQLDLSGRLRPGMKQAILVGRVEGDRQTADARQSPTELLLDDQAVAGPNDRHWVIYRFVLPVEDDS